MGCSRLLPSVLSIAASAPECSLLPGALPWLGKAELKCPSLGFGLWELPQVSWPQVCCPRVPGAAALPVAAPECPGVCVEGVKWSFQNALFAFLLCQCKCHPGAWSREELQRRPFLAGLGCSRLGWAVPGQSRAGAGCAGLWAPRGPLCCAPIAPSIWEPPPQTLHSSTEPGGARGATPTQKSPGF